MITQQEALDTLNTLRDEISRKGLSDKKDLIASDYFRTLDKFDTLIASIQALSPPPNCVNNWIVCSCLHHQRMRDTYAANEREKELRQAELSD